MNIDSATLDFVHQRLTEAGFEAVEEDDDYELWSLALGADRYLDCTLKVSD